MNFKLILIGLLLVLFSTQVYADTTPPVTTFSSFQVPNTTDQNITLTCTDNNTGCKAINYNINGEGWNTAYNDINAFNNWDLKSNPNLTIVNNSNIFCSNNFCIKADIGNLVGIFKWDDTNIPLLATHSTSFQSAYNGGQGYQTIWVDNGNVAGKKVTFDYRFYKSQYDCNYGYVDDTNTFISLGVLNSGGTNQTKTINFPIGTNKRLAFKMYASGSGVQYNTVFFGEFKIITNNLNNYSITYSGTGDHNIQYFSTDNSDNNETIKTSNFTTYGAGKFTFYDENSLNLLNSINYTITPSINGVSSGTTDGNTLDLNLQGITTGTYTFTFAKPDYTTLSFVLPLTQYTDLNYSFVLINSNNSTNVNFQVFNESGAYANTKTFFAYDYSLDKYVGIQTTDTLGRLSFNLNQRKSDYNFFSTDFNFGTTVWNINKPKDALTLLDINGNWDYSITGASYSSASNIVAGIQKLLLQNTIYPYTIKITDTNKNYIPTTFGLKSVTSEKTKTLTPYLYKRGDADLKLIKLIDFSTNQPHSNPEELKLNLYNDTNGLIPIGVFVNDSTGTYNIFMDKNATYELQVLSQLHTLRPTLDIYYLYLTQDVGILIDNNLLVDANVPVMDSNLPIIFMQVREVVFGCTMDQENCYPSMIFSLIAISLLLIVLSISGQVGAISQSIFTGILLTIFLIVGFIPLWLFGVGVVILIAWGVFGQ